MFIVGCRASGMEFGAKRSSCGFLSRILGISGACQTGDPFHLSFNRGCTIVERVCVCAPRVCINQKSFSCTECGVEDIYLYH